MLLSIHFFPWVYFIFGHNQPTKVSDLNTTSLSCNNSQLADTNNGTNFFTEVSGSYPASCFGNAVPLRGNGNTELEIINISSCSLTADEIQVVKLGLTFCPESNADKFHIIKDICLKTAHNKVKKQDRNSLIFSNRPKNSPESVRIITQYSRQHKQIRNIIRKCWPLLSAGPAISKHVKPHPVFTYKRAPSLKDHLVKSHFDI